MTGVKALFKAVLISGRMSAETTGEIRIESEKNNCLFMALISKLPPTW